MNEHTYPQTDLFSHRGREHRWIQARAVLGWHRSQYRKSSSKLDSESYNLRPNAPAASVVVYSQTRGWLGTKGSAPRTRKLRANQTLKWRPWWERNGHKSQGWSRAADRILLEIRERTRKARYGMTIATLHVFRMEHEGVSSVEGSGFCKLWANSLI